MRLRKALAHRFRSNLYAAEFQKFENSGGNLSILDRCEYSPLASAVTCVAATIVRCALEVDGVRVNAQRSAEEGLAASVSGLRDGLLSCDVNFASYHPVLRPDHQHILQRKGAQQLMASSQRRKRL